MATSGTTAFDLDILEIIEEAFEMVGKEVRSGYDLKTARRSLNLLMREWSNRGINFWTISEKTESVSANATTITLDSDTVDVLDASWRTGTGTSQADRPLTRVDVKSWSHIVNKNQTSSEPSQFWVNRLATPVMHIWPVPSSAGTLLYYAIRRIQDVGVYGNTMDVPPRFLPALTSGLAYYLAIKTPDAADRIAMIQAEYERQFTLAAEEDRERASLFLTPFMG